VHGQASIVAQRPANALWDQVTLTAEVAANALLATTSGKGSRDPRPTDAAAAVAGAAHI